MPRQTERSAFIGTAIFAAILIGLLGCRRDSTSTSSSAKERNAGVLSKAGEPAVELVIDYGDGVQKRFTRIRYENGMTALAALRIGATHPRGITFESAGSGSSALVTRLDNLANEADPGGKNWLYRINGKLADKSCDAYVLSPGDVVLWVFEEYE